MIQNLINAVLVSMAVGGNTATAFIKQPKLATSESTTTESYNISIANIRTEINSRTQTETGIERTLKTYRYLDSQNNYLIQGNTYKFDESWSSKSVDESETYTTSMSITILKCIPYYNVKLDNSDFIFEAQAYWQSNYLSGSSDWYSHAKAIMYNATTNLDQYISSELQTKQAYIDLYTTILNYNNNYVLDTASDTYFTDIYPEEQAEPQWNNMPITLHIDQYSLNSRTPFYITLLSEVLISGIRDEGNMQFTSYGSAILNPNGTMAFNLSWNQGQQGNINVEVVDIPSVMYTVLTMPFSFITQAFNLTLFPNTPYFINVADIFKILLTILIIIFIAHTIMRFTK